MIDAYAFMQCSRIGMCPEWDTNVMSYRHTARHRSISWEDAWLYYSADTHHAPSIWTPRDAVRAKKKIEILACSDELRELHTEEEITEFLRGILP